MDTTPLPSFANDSNGMIRPLIIRNGTVITMDSDVGIIPGGDVLIRDGVIEKIGNVEDVYNAEIIDAAGQYVLPGLIDTHTHMWNGIWRSYIDTDGKRSGYEELSVGLGPLFSPEDSYLAVLAASLEMMNAGITTAHNWAHNLLTGEHAEAELTAMRDAGIRSRFSYGYHWNLPQDKPMDMDVILALKNRWDNPMNTVGIALRNDNTGDPEDLDVFRTIAVPRSILLEEVAFAREHGMPITQHLVFSGGADYWIEQGYIKPDNLIVHGYDWNKDDWRALAEAGIICSISPYTATGHWRMDIPLLNMLENNVPMGLSFDTMGGGPGRADMFRLMQHLIAAVRVSSGSTRSPKEILTMATRGGASVLGLADTVGTITVGKRADIIVLRTDALGMAPVVDPYAAIVNSCGVDHVRDVIIDGVTVKRSGSLIGHDASVVSNQLSRTFHALLERYWRTAS